MSPILTWPSPTIARCFHVLLFRNEGGRPVVYAKEHDLDSQPWVGRPGGGGWPIFMDASPIPTFDSLRLQPRTPLKHFAGIQDRALYFIAKWQGQLQSTRGLSGSEGPAFENRQRHLRAISWWRQFLEDHNTRFQVQGQDVLGAALSVTESGRGDEQDLLPLQHDGQVPDLGPIVER